MAQADAIARDRWIRFAGENGAPVIALDSRRGRKADVGGLGHAVDPHEIDLRQADLDLAASHDSTAVEDQEAPDYENQSQEEE